MPMAVAGSYKCGAATRRTPGKPRGAARRAEPHSYLSTRSQALASSFFSRDMTLRNSLHKNQWKRKAIWGREKETST